MGFKDHHPYSLTDMQRIVTASLDLDCSFLVTTDKDFVRLPNAFRPPIPLVVLGIQIDFKYDNKGLSEYMAQSLARILPNKRPGQQVIHDEM
jgi:tetraacyldisaccharide-1-P 4'-kinase